MDLHSHLYSLTSTQHLCSCYKLVLIGLCTCRLQAMSVDPVDPLAPCHREDLWPPSLQATHESLQSVGIGDNCPQDLGLVGTIGSQLPLLPGHTLLVDPAPICQGPVTHQLKFSATTGVRDASSDSLTDLLQTPQCPCLPRRPALLGCSSRVPYHPSRPAREASGLGFMVGLWTRRPPMLRDVQVFPVPEFLPGRSWGGDKKDAVTCSCDMGVSVLLTSGQKVDSPGLVSCVCFPRDAAVHSPQLSLYPGLWCLCVGVCVCVCVEAGFLLCGCCCRNPGPAGLLVPAYRAPNSLAWLCHWPYCPMQGSELP